MARSPEIERILEAWWQTEHCPPAEKAKAENHLNELLDLAVTKSKNAITRAELLNHFYSRYKDYIRDRRKREAVEVAQSALKK